MAARVRGRGGASSSANSHSAPTDVAAASDVQPDQTAPPSSSRNVRWTDPEVTKMLTALRDFVKENGLPANTHQVGAERSNTEVAVPIGWQTVAAQTSHDALQTMRKFDNLKSEVKDLFALIKLHWDEVLTELSTELIHRAPTTQLTFTFLKLHYRIMESYPFGFTFDEEQEPKADLDDALKKCIERHATASKRSKSVMYLFEVVPLFIEINEFGGKYPKNALVPGRNKNKRRQEEKHFELSSNDREIMAAEVNSPAVSSNSDSANSNNSNNSARRRPRMSENNSIAEGLSNLANSTTTLSQAIHMSFYIKQLDERFTSFEELIHKAKITGEEVFQLDAAGITELSDLLIVDRDELRRILSPLSYARLKVLTANTNLNL